MENGFVIKIENLVKKYQSLVAVDGLNLEIPKGQLFGFLGPNGAGKTTTIKLLMGLLKPTGGSISIGGVNIHEDPVQAKAMVGYIPDRPYVYNKLTGMEYLEFIGDLFSMEKQLVSSRAKKFLEFFDLKDFAHELIEGYSHGMKQKLIISGALIHAPKVVVVDEPMVGLDPRGARQVKNLFRDLCREGTTVFMSTHSLGIAEAMCHRVGIILKGKMIAVGSVDDLRFQAEHDNSDLEEIFLKLTGDNDMQSLVESLKVS
ncbi:Efflux ABC transporter, ATP-binding protein [hydrothermal vent metagenome]|uniref:Efflux ABC transporter, ATP-binding protein n=1 Tax=hydrothermal vent metagenome TaxID=652676 RepID=A0A3B1D6I0_9ZZZZ